MIDGRVRKTKQSVDTEEKKKPFHKKDSNFSNGPRNPVQAVPIRLVDHIKQLTSSGFVEVPLITSGEDHKIKGLPQRVIQLVLSPEVT